MLRRCSKCGTDKPSGEFYAHPRGRDGLFSACKLCHGSEVKANRRLKRRYYAAALAAWRQRKALQMGAAA